MRWRFIFIFLFVLGIFIVNSEGFDKLKSKVSVTSCPNDLIPERFTVREISSVSGAVRWAEPQIINNWKNGRPIELERIDFAENTLWSLCHKGANIGENINYFYCNNFTYNNRTQIIDSAGNMISNQLVSLSIDLVLKPEGDFSILKKNTFMSKPEGYNAVSYDSSVVFTKGEVWVAESEKGYPNEAIFRNYSVISTNCKKR